MAYVAPLARPYHGVQQYPREVTDYEPVLSVCLQTKCSYGVPLAHTYKLLLPRIGASWSASSHPGVAKALSDARVACSEPHRVSARWCAATARCCCRCFSGRTMRSCAAASASCMRCFSPWWYSPRKSVCAGAVRVFFFSLHNPLVKHRPFMADMHCIFKLPHMEARRWLLQSCATLAWVRCS